MTRTRLICLTACLAAVLLSGCGASPEPVSAEPAGTPLDMAAEIINSQADIPPLESLTFGQPEFTDYLTQIYGIPEEGLTDGAVFYAGGIEASEIAVLAFSGGDAAGAAESALLDYIKIREDSFTGYVPEQAALVENSTAVRQGRWAALLICAGPEEAREAFLSCFEEGWEPASELPELPVLSPAPEAEAPASAPAEPETESKPPESPEKSEPVAPAELPEERRAEDGDEEMEEVGPDGASAPSDSEETGSEAPAPPPEDAPEASSPPAAPEDGGDSYSHDAVTAAWRSGDPSGLAGKNRAVYDAAADVISQVITDKMTPYQRELAIHDYITAHCKYDPEALSSAPSASPDPDNENPYGMLVRGVGICYGYSSTFQLLMDLLDIECVTVPGRSGQREHAWNMVRLDGEWYCVDVTWDDPAGGSPSHRYFNVTSKFLRDNRHQWDDAGVPEATASRWAYRD